MTVKIRAIAENDFPEWLPLWDGNNLGQRDQLVTTKTWGRLLDEKSGVFGIVAEEKGKLLGLTHFVLHPTTGAVNDACYMQDVFVDPNSRGKGIAHKMVQHLARLGRKEKWARMYWMAESDNVAAQALYKNIGHKLNFTFHVMPF
tara:strand:- start:656 stop:1090 length:435 start_codon:yes stop_codon:yes gene_type:complete